jgi:hypothetical protein
MSPDLNIERITSTLSQALSDITAVKVKPFYTSEIFTLRFMENFLLDSPGTINQDQAASQSNWTYHTALSTKKSAHQMGLNCVFETMGRLDAVIGTYEAEPEILLFAEWEANPRSIFDEGEELDKLWQGASQHKKADAFLFTYCPQDEYPAFLKSVVGYWQSKGRQVRRRPLLYLVTWVYETVNRVDTFQYVSTVQIHQEGVHIWGDLRSAHAPF